MKYKYDEATEATMKSWKQLLIETNEKVMVQLESSGMSNKQKQYSFHSHPDRVKILEELSEVYKNAIPISIEVDNEVNK